MRLRESLWLLTRDEELERLEMHFVGSIGAFLLRNFLYI
jgi:hypothetical protein